MRFFEEGPAKDPLYVAIRDRGGERGIREPLEKLWERFAPVADPAFRQRAKEYFHGQFWEMYLYVALVERGLNVRRASHEGPDFCVELQDGRLWIEAVAPSMGAGPDAVPEIQPGVARSAPEREIILRMTSTLHDKLEQYRRAARRGIVATGDRFLVAMNTWGCDPFYGGQPPYFLKAFLPIGHLSLTLNTRTMEVTGREVTFRQHVTKSSGSSVSTDAFFATDFAEVSAAMNSHVYYASDPHAVGADFEVLHNPRATAPLDPGLFAFAQQQWVHEDDDSFWLANEPPETLWRRPAP